MGSASHLVSEGASACGGTSQGVVIEVVLRCLRRAQCLYHYPEHISNQQRESATRSRRKLTLLSRAEMACLHSSAVPSIRWVIRPVRLIFGVFASMTGAGASEKRVTDEQQQRLDCRDLPSDGSRVAPIRGAGVKEAGRGVSRGHLPSTPRPIWVMSIASGSGTWRSVAFQNRTQMEIEPNRQEGVL